LPPKKSLFFYPPHTSPYFRRRSNHFEGLAVASFLGVASGIYIWKPVIDEMASNQAERQRREALEVGSIKDGKDRGESHA